VTNQPEPPLELLNVSRWYGNVVAVNDVSFALQPGITGLLGPNGAGKSTILNMLSGFLRPSSGSVKVMGARAWRNPGMYRHIGIVPEREAVYGFLTGNEFVRLQAKLQKLPDPDTATRSAIAAVEMQGAQDRATGGYSKGMKQRIKIAAALVHDPDILLLDEPFNGTDPRQRIQLMDLLRRMAADGKTIVFSSHILEEVERLAQSILVIIAGRLAASGDFRHIRRLMTDRPHTFRVESSDNRLLAAALIQQEGVFGVELQDGHLSIRSSDFGAFTQVLPRVARDASVTLLEVRPADESLESVFSYLVSRS
jgi:ABC-2 type transport system ATP-binding protein